MTYYKLRADTTKIARRLNSLCFLHLADLQKVLRSLGTLTILGD
jgi:hypothetical protein